MTRQHYLSTAFEDPKVNEPLRDDQVQNSSGAYVWKIDPWKQLDRFLILGTAGGTYYVGEQKLTRDNAKAVLWCLDNDPERTLRRVEEISHEGRAPKNDPAIFAIVLGLLHKNVEVRQRAAQAFKIVVRTGSHFILLKKFLVDKSTKRNGKIVHRMSQGWFNEKNARDLAYQAIKYQQREGWRLKDLLALARPKPASESHKTIYHWMMHGWDSVGDVPHPDPNVVQIWAFEKAKRAKTEREIVKLIEEYKLPREAVPTEHLNSKAVWAALLRDMPIGATIRNLPKLTSIGLLTPNSDAVRAVVERITNEERLIKARIHPVDILDVMRLYGSGGNYSSLSDYGTAKGPRGTSVPFKQRTADQMWRPVSQIVDALDAAFYMAFKAIKPTGKRWMLALDVSGSMNWYQIAGCIGLTPRVASAALAMVTAKTEQMYHVVAFASRLSALSLSPRQRLDDIIRIVSSLPATATDCALPMQYATQNRIPVDVFAIYTDNETNQPNSHPATALERYRQASGIPAKMIVLGMQANEFSIADPNDPNALDICGLDTATPALMSDFVTGAM